MSAMFSSLKLHNYRLWFGGALVSNTGTWMQSTAQDWLVLTHLTHNNATALGVTMALQFLPPILMIPVTGLIADRYDRRRMLMLTQALLGALGLFLGILVVTGVVQLWMVWAFALALGIVQAIDAPIRQSFVSELVPPRKLSNAVSLNSASFNGARLLGPAVAGVLIAVVGTGPVFLINAASFLAVLTSLRFIRVKELQSTPKVVRAKGQIKDGFRYVKSRPDLVVVFVMIFIIGTFGLNFPIFTSTMATQAFHVGSSGFGLLTSAVAVGSLTGALLSARRDRPRMRILVMASISFGVTCAVAALMPSYWSFALVLIAVGFSSITLMTTANGTVQLGAAPEMRGRVMALYMAIFTGGTPIGAPIVGWVASQFGPREAIGVGSAAGFVAAAVAIAWLVRRQHLRLRHDAGLHFHVRHDGDGMPPTEAIALPHEVVAGPRDVVALPREVVAADLEAHETVPRR